MNQDLILKVIAVLNRASADYRAIAQQQQQRVSRIMQRITEPVLKSVTS